MKISIITATYNNEATIKETLESVAKQDYQNIEHIIIDGVSTDNTLKIIENYKHISKVISEKDFGIYHALNKGIKHSTGELIGFLHADDYFEDISILSEIAKTVKKHQADAIYGDLDYISTNDTEKIIRHWKSKEFKLKLLKKGWMPPHPTFYAKKQLYNKFGIFNTNYKISADYELMLRFLSKNISVKYIPKVIVKMRVGGVSNNSFSNIITKSKEDYKAIKANKIGGIFTLLNKNFSKISQFWK